MATYKMNEGKKGETRFVDIYKDGEFNARFMSKEGEGYIEFMNRIDSDVRKQTEDQISTAW